MSVPRRTGVRSGLSGDSPLLGGTLTVGAGAEDPRAPEPAWDPGGTTWGSPARSDPSRPTTIRAIFVS